MKSHEALIKSKSGRMLTHAHLRLLSTTGKFVLAASILAVISLSPVSGAPGKDDQDQDRASKSRIQQGFDVAPVPLELDGKNLALVGLGSYIVNAQGDCSSCHTSVAPDFVPGANPFVGQPEQIDQARYLIGGRQFGGPTGPRSRNLTPDLVTGLPAGYTFEEFLHVMRTGEDLKRLPPFVPSAQLDLLQIMPWPVFEKMTDRDIRAIYEYLRSVPSLTGGFPR